MVNKKSPWYIENSVEFDKISTAPKNNSSLIYIFSDDDDMDYFLERHAFLVESYDKPVDFLDILSGKKKSSTPKIKYFDEMILDYKEEFDIIEIDETIPKGFYRIIPTKRKNFIELPLKEESSLLLKKIKV